MADTVNRKMRFMAGPLQEFFEYIEQERAKDFEVLARKYRAIGPLLTKVEGLVVHTNTGKSPRLAQYYSHWEKKIFDSLSKVNKTNSEHV